MNYLAHLYLSGNNTESLIGNFIADAVKGYQAGHYSPGIQEGIRLHRLIDSYTDTHPIVGISKSKLREQYGKYTPVIIDIFYDHFLAKNWNHYSNEPLDFFSKKTYDILKNNRSIFPEKANLFLSYVLRYNILEGYADVKKIRSVFRGMSQRATFESKMETATDALLTHYNSLENEFMEFFPQLEKYINTNKRY